MPSRVAGTRVGPVVITVVLLTLAAGCVAVPGTGVTATDLETQVNETTPPEGINATLETTYTIDGETTTYREDIKLRADGASRIETDGVLVVSDGETRWRYDRETDAVQRLELDPDAPSLLEGLYAQQEQYFERYDVETIERTTIDGRDVYRVAFDPPADESIGRSVAVRAGDTEFVIPLERTDGELEGEERTAETVEVWLDEAHLFPVKYRVAGNGIALETTYHNLSVNPGLDDDLFEFEPPAEAGDNKTEPENESVEDIALPSIESHETVADAEDAVPFPVAEPPSAALPGDLSLDEITSYEFPGEERRQVSLFYRGNDETISVTTSDGPRRFAVGGEDVTVGSAAGTIAETEEGTELEWSCESSDRNHYYSIFVSDGLGDDRQLALKIGETLECA